MVVFNNCHFGNDWDVTNFQIGGAYSDYLNSNNVGNQWFNRRASNSNSAISLNHNFKFNKTASWNGQTWRSYDESEGAWRVYPDGDNNNWKGFTNDVMVPANTQVFIRGTVKSPAGVTNYPVLVARHIRDYHSGAYRNIQTASLDPTSDISKITPDTGFWSQLQFTNSSNQYQTQVLTIPALPFDYILSVGIGTNGTSGTNRLGWWEKDIEIAIDTPYGFTEARHLVNTLTTRLPVQTKQTSSQLKTILGG
jgi:hypothetical protein